MFFQLYKTLPSLGYLFGWLCILLQICLSIKLLYCALVRSIVEYGAVIWDLHTICDSLKLESVQRKFLRYQAKLNIPCESHNYNLVALQVGLVSLAERKCILENKFLDGMLRGNIGTSELLSLISFRVLQHSPRFLAPFYIPFSSTYFLKNEPIKRMMYNANVDLSFLLNHFVL